MLGAIIGSIIGSGYSGNSHNTKSTDFPLITKYSRVTDNVILMTSIADALMELYGLDIDRTKAGLTLKIKEYVKAYPSIHYARRFYEWAKSSDSQPYHSYGNGCVLRASSVGWLYTTLEDVMNMAKITAEITHDHPDGIKGAQSIATSIYFARQKKEKREIADFLEKQFCYDLSEPLSGIRPTYSLDTTCRGSVPQAIRAFLEGTDYESCVRLAVSIGGDSDVIAGIAGAIAEAYYGIPDRIRMRGMCVLKKQAPKIAEMLPAFYDFSERANQTFADRVHTQLLRNMEEAIHNGYIAGECANPEPIFNAVAEAMLDDVKLILPVESTDIVQNPSNAGQDTSVEDNAKCEYAGTRIIGLPCTDSEYWVPAFTNEEEAQKGKTTSTITEYAREVILRVRNLKTCKGVIINPWGEKLTITQDVIHILCMHQIKSHISILKADITQMQADVIVNAARHSLQDGGGLNGHIHRKAGPQLLEECLTLGGCHSGEAKITESYDLPCRNIIHTAGPVFMKEENPERLLQNCYVNSLELARQRELHSIVFPCIATGNFGYPHDAAARVAVQAIIKWISDNSFYVMNIYICCYHEEDLRIYQSLLDEYTLQEEVEPTPKEDDFEEYFLAAKLYAKARDPQIGCCFDTGNAWIFGHNNPNEDEPFSVAVMKDSLDIMSYSEFLAVFGEQELRFIPKNLFTGKNINPLDRIRYGDGKKIALAINEKVNSCRENNEFWAFYNALDGLENKSVIIEKRTGNAYFLGQHDLSKAEIETTWTTIDFLHGNSLINPNDQATKTEYVQAFINNISFPSTLQSLISESRGHLGAFAIEEFELCDYTEWTAPKWCKSGDIVFFMHAKSVLAKIKHLEHMYKIHHEEYSDEDCALIENRLKRARDLYGKYGGKIFALGRVKRGVFHSKNGDPDAHWRSNVYAPIEELYVLENPIPREDFCDFITVSSASALTAVFGDQFTRLKEIILSQNSAPEYLVDSVAVPMPLAKINDDNWLTVCNQYRNHFFLEIQFRSFYVDRFLRVLGDRKKFHIECPCYKELKKPSYVDNVILFAGKYLPVECKLSVPSEVDIKGQVHKYCSLQRLVLDNKTDRTADLHKVYSSQVLIIDTEKLYLFDDKEYEVTELKLLDDIHTEDDILKFRQELIEILKKS